MSCRNDCVQQHERNKLRLCHMILISNLLKLFITAYNVTVHYIRDIMTVISSRFVTAMLYLLGAVFGDFTRHGLTA